MKADQEKEIVEIMYSIMKSLDRIANSLDEREGE
jgi:hypothetical protein